MDPALASLLGAFGGGLLTWALSEIKDRRQTRERRADEGAARAHGAERENVQWVRAAHVDVYSRYLRQTADVALALMDGTFDRNEIKASLDDARSAVATLTLLAPEEVRAAIAEHHQFLSLLYVVKLRAIDAGDDQERAAKFEEMFLSSLDDELEAREQVQSAMRASLGVAPALLERVKEQGS